VFDTIAVTESVVEEVVLNLFEGLGYSILNGPTIGPEQPTAERASFVDVILLDRLRGATASSPIYHQTLPVPLWGVGRRGRIGSSVDAENRGWGLTLLLTSRRVPD